MKTGRVSQTTWRRTVSKYMENDESRRIRPALEECCSELAGMKENGQYFVCAQAAAMGDAWYTPVFAMAEAENALASKGAKAEGFLFSYDLPSWMEEGHLKAVLAEAARAGKERTLPILNIQVQTNPFVQHMLVHVIAAGHTGGESGGITENGMLDLVMCGTAGLAGSIQILDEKEAELKERFQSRFLQGLSDKRADIFAADAAEAAYNRGARIAQAGQGGILAALWNLGESLGTGMELDMKKIPIYQETIEVCEQYDVNPYLLTSAGTMLFALAGGEVFAEELRLRGYRAAVIGRTIRGKERILRNGEDIRYLDRPVTDEIWKIF